MLESLSKKVEVLHSGLLQDLSFTRPVKILFFIRQNLKRKFSFFYKLCFSKNVKCKVMFAEAYLEPSRTSKMEPFCQNR